MHAGDPQLGLGPDQVTIELWEKIGMPAERIVPLPTSENFWSVGGPGPCGPDSELYYDRGEDHGCGELDCAPGCNRCERYLEFWNLVFMEYEQHADGTLTPLPAQNIDTGLGLERGAAVLQGVMSVYETDGYQEIMEWIAAESGVAYGDSPAATKAHRVLADHGRGMTFLVGDGVTPSNEGRGYVLRRIIRRAVQQAQRIGLADVYRLPAVVVAQMASAYPELAARAAQIEDVVRAEEERFGETLERGLKLFEGLAGNESISGEEAFTLAATYGFPLELTVELAEERGQPVDVDGYRTAMERHREVSEGRREQRPPARRRLRARGGLRERVRRLREDRRPHPDRRARRGRGRPLPGEAPRVALLRGRRRPGHGPGDDRARRRLRDGGRARGGVPVRGRSGAPRPGPGSPRETACAPSSPGTCGSRRWRTTRGRTSCTGRCATSSASTSARRARLCGRTSSASTSRTSTL